jgi:predicted nucleic-acid-binding Zn-ribbon protein
MRGGLCPKCGHATVHSGRDDAAKSSSNNRLPIDLRNSVPLDNYVCITCGYVESYISDEKARQQINEKWPHANDTKRKRKR